MIEGGKQKAYEDIKEYLELQLKSPTRTLHSQSASDEDEQAYAPRDSLQYPAKIGNILAHCTLLAQRQIICNIKLGTYTACFAICAVGIAAVGCGIQGLTGGVVLKSNPAKMQGNIKEKEQQDQLDIEMESAAAKNKNNANAVSSCSAAWAPKRGNWFCVMCGQINTTADDVICSVRNYCLLQLSHGELFIL